MIIMYVTFIFATLKLQHLMSKHNPSVNVFVDRDAFDESYIWSGADDPDFMMAFMVADYSTGEPKNDPAFVKWYVQYYETDDNVEVESEIPIHPCTKDDLAKFHPANKLA